MVGAGQSATTTLLDLVKLAESELQTSRHLGAAGAITGPRLGGGGDMLPARGSIGTRVRTLVERGIPVVTAFHTDTVRTQTTGESNLSAMAVTEHGRRWRPMWCERDRVSA